MTTPLASRRHLFIDSSLIAQMHGVTRTANRPRFEGAVLEPGPEGSYNDAFVGFYGSVMDDDGTYKMWLHGRSAQALTQDTPADWPSQLPLGYYTSRDGIHWDAPNLGLIDWNGSRDNNIVCLEFGYVFKDPKPRNDNERYKLLPHASHTAPPGAEKETGLPGGLYMYTSPDGIHWILHPKRLLALFPDCLNQIIYDRRINKHVAYLRCWPTKLKLGYGFGRAVCRLELDDPMAPWPHPQIDNPRHFWGKDKVPTVSTQYPIVMEYPGYETYERWTDLYDPQVVQYPWADDVYLAFPEFNRRFHMSPFLNHSKLEIGLCVSRDGIKWDWPTIDPYIPFSKLGQGRTGMNYNIPGLIRRGDEIWQYHFGTPIDHMPAMGIEYGAQRLLNSGRIYRSVQRLDGFVSLDFSADGGQLLTDPLTFTGRQLLLNIKADVGNGQVELCDESGSTLPGFASADCDPIRVDAVNHPVAWRGKTDLSAVQGRAIRLKMTMTAAKLYAMQFM